MPKLWNATIGAHRDAVREALLTAVGDLVEEAGLTGVSMAGIAARAGVGRATLYRYFPDLESVLGAWHERHVVGHIAALEQALATTSDPARKLVAAAETYARLLHGSARHGGSALSGMLHHSAHAAAAEARLRRIFCNVLAAASLTGAVRRDVPPDDLAEFAIAALGAAGRLSAEGTARLVELVLAALRPQ